MKRQWGACLVLAVGIVFCSGCASLPRATGVVLSVASVRPLQGTLLETKIELMLRLTNEGVEPLTLDGSTHRVHLNGTYVGRAVSNERIVVPRLGTVTQVVTAHLENLILVRKFAEFSQTPKMIAYRLDSRFHPADGRGFGPLKVSATGELDLAGLTAQLSDPAPGAR